MITIDLTEQQLFDGACEHFAAQKKQSVDANGTCYYRGPNGLKCVWGYFIPDAEYDEGFEGRGIISLILDHSIVLSRIDKVSSFPTGLQVVHDGAAYLHDLKNNLSDLAADHNLDPTKIDLITEWNTK
jgi:hypothetical protein